MLSTLHKQLLGSGAPIGELVWIDAFSIESAEEEDLASTS